MIKITASQKAHFSRANSQPRNYLLCFSLSEPRFFSTSKSINVCTLPNCAHVHFCLTISTITVGLLKPPGLCERKQSLSVVSDTLRPHGLQPTRLLHPWDFPGNSPGVGCHFLLQGIFPAQRSNPGLQHCRQALYRLSHQGQTMV